MLNEPINLLFAASQLPWAGARAQTQQSVALALPAQDIPGAKRIAGCGRGCPDCTCTATFGEFTRTGR